MRILQDMLFSASEFHSTDLCGVVAAASPKTCEHYVSVFRDRIKRAEREEDDVSGRVFGLFWQVCSLWLKPDDRSDSLSVQYRSPDGQRSVAVPDFSAEQIELLKGCIGEIGDADLRARIADLIWVYQPKGNFPFAEQAVDAYLESGECLLFWDNMSLVHAIFAADRLTRAMNLAASLGKGSDRFGKAVKTLRALIKRYAPNHELPLKLLMDLLFEFNHEEPLEFASLAESYAQHRETLNEWPFARGGWETAIRWYRAAGDDRHIRACRMQISYCWEQEAEATLRGGQELRNAVAAHHLQSAIQALREISGTESQRDTLHKRMLALQAQSVGQLKVFSGTMDISRVADAAIECVKGKELQEAILTLSVLDSPPEVAYLRKFTEQSAKAHPLYSLVGMTSVDDQGRTVAHRGSLLAGPQDEQEEALRAEMHKHAVWHQGVVGWAAQIASRQIALEHRPRLEDLLEITAYSPFVRPGKEMIYARGLLAGLEGDFLVALSLVVPQVEDSLRYLLEQKDVITTKFSAEGIQDVKDLNDLLALPELRQMFGDDLVFDMEGMFVDRFGSNFRNKLAHGLLDSGAFYTDEAAYIWWSILRLCCIPLIKTQTETPNAQETAS